MFPSNFTSRSKYFLKKGSLTTPAEILNRRLEERKQLQLVGLPGHKSPSIRGSVTWNLKMFGEPGFETPPFGMDLHSYGHQPFLGRS